jgi:uncharacterized protein (TIGR02302 family)
MKSPITGAVSRARWAIFWERLWPALATIATLIGLFLAVSWLGLWLWLSPTVRIIGVVCFAVAALAALVPFIRLRMPSKADGLRRLDRASRIPHRPATAIADDIMATPGDPVSMALWRAHVERALAAAHRLKAGLPLPRLAVRDPVALRSLVLMLVVATFFAAGSDRTRRIVAAFDWAGAVAAPNFRVDAWVTPPNYTGRPPVILPGLRAGEATRGVAGPVAVPAGSTLVIRATGKNQMDVSVSGGLAATSNDAPAPTPAGTEEHRYTIADSGQAVLRGVGGGDLSWSFTAIPDKPPTIALAKDPESQARGALQLSYKIEDDYGVTDAQATFALKQTAKDGKTPRPLYGAPDFPLVLPQARTRNGTGQTLKEMPEHPWAGVDALMTLVARDEAGNEGRSSAHELKLPERIFVKPLARALIEQRRILALDGDAKPIVLSALDALTIAPERFTPEPSIYLGLRSIYWQLARAKSDDALREVIVRLWDMAVGLEDGNVSDAEAALRAAQEALKQALDRGASDEEIKRLMDQLRAALDKFMQALAEELRKNPQLARPLDRNQRMMRSQDLKSMLDRLERMARSGQKEAARRMLEELQAMLENLQMARPGQDMDGDDNDDMSALDELGDMIRKQQQLRDRTFRQGQDQRRQRGQRGQQGEKGDQNAFGEMRQDQQALREQLNKLLQELKKRGLGQQQGQQQGQRGQQGQQGQKGQGQQGQGDMSQLGEAGEAMGEAEGQLGEGNSDGAVDSQGRALEALRKGAQGLAQALQQQMGQQQGPGPGRPGRFGPARAQQDTDPLGRPLRGRDYGDDTTIKVPREIDVQRARRILEELRRRFGETERPQLELDYIERLLKDF